MAAAPAAMATARTAEQAAAQAVVVVVVVKNQRHAEVIQSLLGLRCVSILLFIPAPLLLLRPPLLLWPPRRSPWCPRPRRRLPPRLLRGLVPSLAAAAAAVAKDLRPSTALELRPSRPSPQAKKQHTAARSAVSPPLQYQQHPQYPPSSEWDRVRYGAGETGVSTFESGAGPRPSSSAARHGHAQEWDPRPAPAQAFSGRQGPTATVSASVSLLDAALAAQPGLLANPTGGGLSRAPPPPNLAQSAALNPAIVAYMQQHMNSMQAKQTNQNNTSRGRFEF